MSYGISYMWNLKKKSTHESIYKTDRVTDVENKVTVASGERSGKDKFKDWD